MNLVNLCCYGCGYYSGSEYEENIVLSEEFYNKIKGIVEDEDYKVYLGELDGKHSEVTGSIEVQHFKDNEILTAGFENNDNDGDNFYWSLKDRIGDLSNELDNDIHLVDEYIKSLDLYENITVSIKRSNKQKLFDFIQILK